MERLLELVLPWGVVAFQGWLIFLLVRQHGRVLLRHDELRERLTSAEAALRDLGERLDEVERGGGGVPRGTEPSDEGLPIGSPAPSFSLSDLDGRQRTLDDFIGRPLVVVFFNTQCGFCMQMAPRLGQLPDTAARVLLISRGDPEEHRKLAAEHGWRCDVVLEPSWEVSNTYRANGTPTGYLLDAQGRVASSLAIGADALLDLAQGAPAVGSSNGHADVAPESRVETPGAYVAEARAGSASRPREGLAAGTPAPDFRLPDLDGREHALTDFRGRPVLLVFSDPTCLPCQALAPELQRLHRARGEELRVVMVSRGDPERNRERVREHGLTFPALLQRGWEVSKAYGTFAMPVGYLLDERGVIVKDAGVGKDGVLELV